MEIPITSAFQKAPLFCSTKLDNSNLNSLIKHQHATFKSLSSKFSESEGKPVMYEYEVWLSQDYFALLGELKTNLDENEEQLSDIDYLYEKYKSHIPLR